MSNDAVVVQNLGKRYSTGAQALQDVNLRIERGEIYCLMGADGAGKTTAFHIMAGVLEPSAGTVTVMGQPARASRDRVGYLTQRFSLYQDMSVMENLRYSAGLRKVPEADLRKRGNHYLELFGLSAFQDRFAGHLSGGMKQKLALCCALVSEPDVLLLDEPTAGVDPVSRASFWEALLRLAGGGMTIIVATPYLDEAAKCGRVALMEQGRVIQVDTPDRFRSQLGWIRLELRSDALAVAQQALSGAAVEDVQRFGDRLDVLVRDADLGEQEVRSRLSASGVTVEQIQRGEATLENAFVAKLRQLRGNPNLPPFPERTRRAGAGNETLIEAVGLEKAFGSFRAVKDFHLEVKRGEIYGLLGANGAGKTTAIKMICGLLAPTRGSISLFGQSKGLRRAGVRTRIGYMSQKFTLYDDLTIRENLDFYASLYGVPDRVRQKRQQWVLKISDLTGQEHRLTASLPGGWRQRVAFGAAIMHEPDLVFLDEPTSGVDPLARRVMWRMIHDLADSGAAVVVVTHYMEEAEQCSRIGFMVAGELAAEGTPRQIKNSGGREAATLEEVFFDLVRSQAA